MTEQQAQEFGWLKAEVARLRELVEPQTDMPATAPPKCGGEDKIRRQAIRTKPRECRTVAEVEFLCVGFSGCCDRHADNMGCDCLSLARRYEASLARPACPVCKGDGWHFTWEGKASQRVKCMCQPPEPCRCGRQDCGDCRAGYRG